MPEGRNLAEEARLFVYHHFVDRGRAPTVTEVAEGLGTDPQDIRRAFEALAERHVLVLDTHGEIWMAMPFSAVPTPHTVTVETGSSSAHTWWANCAWDAFGIPAMLDTHAVVTTHCPLTNTPLEIPVTADAPPVDAPVSHVQFAIPAVRWWEDIGET